MKHFLMGFIALIVPWIVLLLNDNPGGAIVALVMQASIIGWIPASVWAYRTWKENESKSKSKTPE